MPSQQGIYQGNLGGQDGSKLNAYGFKPQSITSNDPVSNFLHSIQNQSTATGLQNTTLGGTTAQQGLTAFGPVLSYLTALTRGDQGDVTQAMQPEINRVRDSFQAARQMISQAPRGGGKAGILAEAPYQESKQIGDMASQARQGAAGQLGTIANQLAGLGIDISSLGLSQEQLGQQSSLTQRQQNIEEKAATEQMIASLAQAAGSVAGAKISAGAKPSGCWIAEAIYGVDDDRTHLVRAWLNGSFRKTLLGRVVMAVYLKIGRTVAKVVRRSKLVRGLFKPLFDRALLKAREEMEYGR